MNLILADSVRIVAVLAYTVGLATCRPGVIALALLGAVALWRIGGRS